MESEPKMQISTMNKESGSGYRNQVPTWNSVKRSRDWYENQEHESKPSNRKQYKTMAMEP